MSSTAEDLPPCFLLKLPPELRNRIFDLVLIQPHRLHIIGGQSPSVSRALLGTCQQIHAEANGIFYSANLFGYHAIEPDLTRRQSSTAKLISWLKRIGSKNRSRLTDVRVWLHNAESLPLLAKLDFLSAQNARLGREGVWLPSTVLRVKVDTEYLHQAEVAVFAGKELRREQKQHDCWKPKDPSIRNWTLVSKEDVLDDEEDDNDLRLCTDCDLKRTRLLFPHSLYPPSPFPFSTSPKQDEDRLEPSVDSGGDDLAIDYDIFLDAKAFSFGNDAT